MACFATSKNIEKIGNGEYQIVSEELAHKDLIILAISIRRLAELTKSQHLLKKRNLKIVKSESYKNDQQATDNCWNIIGNIIHSQDIVLTKHIPQCLSNDIYEMMKNRIEVEAIIDVKSDRKHTKTFSAVHFLKELVSYMEEIEDILSDNKIYVGSLFS
ncbi:hypothetical protein [Rhizobium oryzicola]|uniref:Uncharacterized protein n=1 Tax=Rhizobium oryzicola TaxID=1232668 RepID=A0ABT8T0Z5_9HYPH|nr:hypothetical protein [Rhizobium oryzicola]MDO1584424.1 hypothetical protein [Rhizobium oryzicola]